MVFPPEYRWYKQMIEQQQLFDRYYKPFEEALKQQTLMQKFALPDDYQRQLLEQESILRKSLMDDGILSEIMSMKKEVERNFGSIELIAKELEAFKKSTGFKSVLAAQEELYRFQDQYKDLMGLITPPSIRIESVLASAEATARLLGPVDIFADFTLSSIAEYQLFVNRQYKLLQFDENIVAKRRIEVAELSGDLFENINNSLEIGFVLNKGNELQEDETEDPEIFAGGLYTTVNQHIGVVYSDRFHGQVKKNFNNSIPVRIAKIGNRITEEIYKINLISERNGQGHIFKPTNKTMRACSIISSFFSKDEKEFHLLVDALYFILYEGSGRAKRLEPSKHDELLGPLWKIKHLRLTARHDIDHGSTKDIEKNNEKIKNVYFSLIQQPLPMKQSDWLKAQLTLYTEITFMLQGLLQEFIKK